MELQRFNACQVSRSDYLLHQEIRRVMSDFWAKQEIFSELV